jgi:hypothetical protein
MACVTYTAPEPWWIRAGKYGGAGYGFAIYNAATSGREASVILIALLVVLFVWWLVEVVRWRKQHRV